jgi:hypothetical protein
MTDFNKLADALRSPNKAVRVCATMEAESILRAASAADVAGLIELAAKAIYDQWNGQLGWVQWVPGGNSMNQDEARRIARAALESALRVAMAPKPGFVMVPIEPTEAMLEAAHNGDREYTLRNFGDIMTVMQGPYDHWCAMIAASQAGAAQEPKP